MTNPTSGFGLRPARRIDGAAPNYQLNAMTIAYNQTHQIAKGDPVILATDGTLDVWASGAILGVFWGCEYLDPNLGHVDWKNTWTAPTLASTTLVTAYVILDRNMIWEIVAASGTNVAIADIGQNATITGMSTPSPTGSRGYSTARLGSLNTTSTFPLRITGLSPLVSSDPAAVNNIVEVVFNNTFFTTGTTGV